MILQLKRYIFNTEIRDGQSPEGVFFKQRLLLSSFLYIKNTMINSL